MFKEVHAKTSNGTKWTAKMKTHLVDPGNEASALYFTQD